MCLLPESSCNSNDMMQQHKLNIAPLRIVLPIMAVFFVISAIGIFHHELWLDEAQHFLIGRDSNTLTELYYNMQYDGHVRLWNYCLFFISHYVSANPVAMQVFHLIIICTTVFVFVRYAPFDMITKLLIISGYFFLYEYNVISRNYALGILFLFTACKLLGQGNKNLLWVGLLLVLMCNTHLFFAFAASGIFIYVSYGSLKQKNFDAYFFVFALLFVIALSSVIIQIKIPSDNTYFHPEKIEISSINTISSAFYGLAKGFLPIPLSKNGDFWNHFFFDNLPSFLQMFLALVLLIYPFLLLRKSKTALLFYAVSGFLLLLFLFISQSWASRYFGMFFIFFIVAAWLAGNESVNIFSIEKLRNGTAKAKLFYVFFYFILVCHVFSGVYAYGNDLARPFTEAKNAIRYLQSNHLDTNTIIVDGYGSGPALSAYLGKPVFYLNIDMLGSFCYWKKSYFEVPPKPLAEELMKSSYVATQTDFLLVSVRQVSVGEIRCTNCIYQFDELNRFTHGIKKPDYYIYKVTRKTFSNLVAVKTE
jgi:hypothetical protein